MYDYVNWNFRPPEQNWKLRMLMRSGCPINLSAELLGDRWSLVVLRDIMFGNKRTFGELHGTSLEGIATNMLASRLKKLTDEGMLSTSRDPRHKQRLFYSLTEKAIAFVPVMVQLGAWGSAWLPVTPQFSIRAITLEEGGPALWADFQQELRHLHLGKKAPKRSATALMEAAFERVAGNEAAHGQS